ncbi:MAG: hypothetical protein ACLTT5_00100 [[Eubacterium] siraeum]
MIKQGSVALRIVAFAVALAVVLGLASVMFHVTASAESTNKDIKTGSFSVSGYFDGYPCLNLGTELSFYDFVKNYNTFGYGFCVIPLVTKNNVTYFYKTNSSWNCYAYIDVYTATGSGGGTIFYNGTNFFSSSLAEDNGESYKNYKTVIKKANTGSGVVYNHYQYDSIKSQWVLSWDTDYSMDFYDYKSNTYADNVSPSDIKYVVVSNTSRFLQSKNRNNNWSDLDTIFSANATFTEAGALPSAEFLSFKGTESSGLYLVDWIKTGQQYPIVDFRIDDKGNYHKYALRISGNSNYAEILKGIWDRQEMKEAVSAASNAVGVFLLLNAASSLGTKAVVSIAGASTPIGALFLNVPKKDVTGYVMLAAQNKLVQEYDTLSYDDIRTLSSDNMNFSEGSSTVSKAVSLCLSDYVSVVPNTLYKLEIIDVTESKLLDVAYFSSQRGYQKFDSGYGTNITDYDNSADLDSDIENNNGYTGGSSSNGGKLDTDNPNDIIDTDYNNSLANINISDIIVSLRTSIASVGVFFQSCWALFPPAIWSIILLGLSLIVVLRLLGR